ncbi:hypothetical protein FJV46_00430 [Arthrobacter agilis]|uniref:hypothetical protein n=1 Tax=Arthrobacter agilis TaxID=37921 RepID=UPI000B35E1D7|nr:hypothetical protein [Arthrobacter agilis]OUM40794.1 hypothetical protein B8W74_12660 [Arthrobacter agilis]PPB45397.1 hypothetical protein CI784_12680 [Arthrobacter agilis]TPV28110.1 hypothetical protein FJV46_00430 [Arthrobacter agilis]VDR31666.1 Uncharacterised protein [Arthrobacter agilis]
MDAVWIAVALLVAGGLGSPVTMLVLRLARSVDTAERRRAEPPEPADQPQFELPEPPAEPPRGGVDALPPGVLRGGLVIGVLERLAVTVAVLAGQPVAIAYVVAVKALGRYAELKESPAASERFIIGTLASLLWASGVAAVIKVYVL